MTNRLDNHRKVLEILSQPDNWVQNMYCGLREKDEDGPGTFVYPSTTRRGNCFCLAGAYYMAVGQGNWQEVDLHAKDLGFLSEEDMIRWNDDVNRTFPEVRQRVETYVKGAEA